MTDETVETVEWRIQRGADVVDVEGTHLGRVHDARDGCLVVRRGRFMVADAYVPYTAIGAHDARTIRLNVVADERALEIWHRRPVAVQPGEGVGRGRDALLREEAQLEMMTDADGNVHVPVLQEELVPTTRRVRRGVVRIDTWLNADDGHLESPGTERRVRVERRVHSHDDAGRPVILTDGSYQVPFHDVDPEVEERVRVIEQIIITREAIETVRTVRGTVQRTDVDVIDGSTPEPATD